MCHLHKMGLYLETTSIKILDDLDILEEFGKNNPLLISIPAASLKKESKLYFAIYDRWGELMFETTDIYKGWDGTYKGEPVDPAVFVYYLHATCVNKLNYIKKGNITLIR